jgi:hypothetical protein
MIHHSFCKYCALFTSRFLSGVRILQVQIEAPRFERAIVQKLAPQLEVRRLPISRGQNRLDMRSAINQQEISDKSAINQYISATNQQ